jgi:hypothetical protein
VAAVFDYTPAPESAGPEEFLKTYRGYLQADAYVAYDSFFPDPQRGLVEVACWAHTRRHFHQALDTDSARMGAVLAHIAHLYKVEKWARRSGIVGPDLRLLREQTSVPRSFVASCELAKVDPFAWFQDVLTRIGQRSIQQLDDLLPHRWAAACA